MLGVEHHLGHAPGRLGDAVADHAQVLVAGRADQLDVAHSTLADQRDDLRPTLEQRGEAGIVGGAATGAPGHAEGREPRVLQRGRIAEEAVVGRIGARPAALDIVDAELVE